MRSILLYGVILTFLTSGPLWAEELDTFNQTLMEQAQKALAAKDDPKAEGLLSKILETYPNDQTTLKLASEVYFRQEKYREAASLYSRLLRLNPDDSESLIQLAVSRWRLREGYEAQAALLRALAQNNLTSEQKTLASATLDEIYSDWDVLNAIRQRGDYTAEERFHTHQIEKNPEAAATSYALRGFARHWLERPDEARADFNQALALGGLSDDLAAGVRKSLSEIAAAEDAQRREAEERAAAEEAARLEAAEQAAAEEAARREAEERAAAAEAAAQEAAPEPQVNAYEYFDQIDKLLGRGEVTRAAAVLNQIRGLELGDEEKGVRLYYEGELSWHKGAYDQAAGYYDQAARLIKERFRRSALLMRQAEYQARRGNRETAESLAVKSAGLLSDQPWKLKQAAGFFGELGSNATAVSYYQKALKLDPAPERNRDTFMGLAEIYKLTNDEANYFNYARKYIEASSPRLDRLSTLETGYFYFYRAELRSAQEPLAAYSDYEQAARLITEKYRLSEIYIKMAEYLADVNQADQAAHYAALSAETLPGQPWRNRQAAGIFDRTGHLEQAIHYTRLAMAQEPPDNPEADRELAYLYLRNKDKDNYLATHAAYIDKLTAEVDRQGGRASQELKKELYQARQTQSDISRTWGFDSYNFGTRRDNGDYSAMTINELFLNFTLPTDTPGKVYHRLNGTYASRYSGTYSDPITAQERSWESRTNLEDSVYGILGAKVNPVRRLPDFSAGVEYLYPIGRDRDDDDFRGRLEYNRTWGEKPRPYDDPHWLYAKTYGEMLYSTRHSDFTAFGELSLGRTFSPAFDKNILIMPHLRTNWSYGGEQISKGGRWSLETGPALAVRKWFNEDRRHAPRSYVELGVQYYIGLSHELDDAVGFNVTFSF
ncbi:hypothetical protein C4J81_00865 [Deltaproteobacteria bacterium Smac51]|nr:hypothetical protein C4J81_00865 [Deltaproteobacteria bacterium Smac51]